MRRLACVSPRLGCCASSDTRFVPGGSGRLSTLPGRVRATLGAQARPRVLECTASSFADSTGVDPLPTQAQTARCLFEAKGQIAQGRVVRAPSRERAPEGIRLQTLLAMVADPANYGCSLRNTYLQVRIISGQTLECEAPRTGTPLHALVKVALSQSASQYHTSSMEHITRSTLHSQGRAQRRPLRRRRAGRRRHRLGLPVLPPAAAAWTHARRRCVHAHARSRSRSRTRVGSRTQPPPPTPPPPSTPHPSLLLPRTPGFPPSPLPLGIPGPAVGSGFGGMSQPVWAVTVHGRGFDRLGSIRSYLQARTYLPLLADSTTGYLL